MAEAYSSNDMDDETTILQAHEVSLRTPDLQDTILVHSAEFAERAVRDVPQGDEKDPQVTTKTEFHDSKLKRNDEPIGTLQEKSRGLSNIQKGKESHYELRPRTAAAKKSGTDACTALNTAEWDLHNCQKELRKVQRMKENAQRKSTEQLQELRQKLKDSKRELKASQIATTQYTQSLQGVQAHVITLQSELTACKDDLFRLQPAPPPPDSEIVRGFGIINQAIVNWIGAKLFAFEKAYPNGTNQTFSVENDREATIFLKAHPAAGEHLAKFMIHRFLQVHVFSDDIYLFNLVEKTQVLLRRIEESMAGLKPPRGKRN